MGDKSIYILNDGDVADGGRLDWQHQFTDDITGNELLPQHIMMELAAHPTPKVLDVGTGTGIWLTEMAKRLPASAEFVGLDFDTSKFPEKLPPNVRLERADMLAPFPAGLLGRFDVVHARWIVQALKRGAAKSLVENLLTLLRPGGWVVWMDGNPLMYACVPPSPAFFRFQEVYHAFAVSQDAEIDTPVAIPGWMRQAGCVDVADRTHFGGAQQHGGAAAAAAQDNNNDWPARNQHHARATVRQLLPGILSRGGVAGMRTRAELDDIVAAFDRDFVGGRVVKVWLLRAWGRKPS
ncbi:S-adenosyl-L-methionine-dependent methyltransferase [Xylariaceae sp. FL0804]|nr:S-adenosyl-L-methionine-dependent methyltransferase [Xylariaceae sp. FL0804]